MKRLTNYFFIAAAAMTMVFTSCESDETAMPPTIVLDGSGDYVATDSEINTNAVFKINLTATPNAESGAKLTGITGTRTFNNVPDEFLNEELSKETSFSIEITIQGQATAGTERIVFEVTDQDGEVAEKVLNITYVDAPNQLNAFTAVLMGGQTNTTIGSFLDADAGNVYKQADAEANSELIDIIYYFGNTNNATLVAPTDATVNGGAGNLSLAEGLTTKNATQFNTNPGISAAEFDAMTTDADIAGISTSVTIANQLAVDDVFVFKTAAGKMGAVKVVSIDGESAGTITIDVKIQ
jgi:hypothetical protein